MEQPKASKEGRPWATSRARCARQGQVGKKANPAKKAHKGAKKAKAAKPEGAPGQQDQDRILDLLKRPGGVNRQGADARYGLATSFRTRLPVRDGREEDGASGRHVDQGHDKSERTYSVEA